MKVGLTLVEILVVLAVIVLLATMLIGISFQMDTQSKERVLENTFALLEGALEEYHEDTGDFPAPDEKIFTTEVARSEYLYKLLYSIPSSKKVLEKISDSLIRNEYGDPNIPEIYDPWCVNDKSKRKAIDYKYNPAINNFPLLRSAGPDREFGTADDISNR